MEPTSSIQAAYDTVAGEYAERFAGELAHKPMDRELLTRFSSDVRGLGDVYDVGCGPGHVTAFLCQCGVPARGLDLSANLIREARKRHPTLHFEQGDILALPFADASLGGVVAFYAIVHFSPTELDRALAEVHRVLRPGGLVLLAFHIGDGSNRVEGFLGSSVVLDFVFFSPQRVREALANAGFGAVEIIEREPYPGVEYPSRRAYVLARKAAGGEA